MAKRLHTRRWGKHKKKSRQAVQRIWQQSDEEGPMIERHGARVINFWLAENVDQTELG